MKQAASRAELKMESETSVRTRRYTAIYNHCRENVKFYISEGFIASAVDL
jgi:hypothetical protein